MTNETQTWVEERNDDIDYLVVLDDMLKFFSRNWGVMLAVISVVCTITFITVRALYKPVYIATSTFIVSSSNSAGHDRTQYNNTVASQLGNVFP